MYLYEYFLTVTLLKLLTIQEASGIKMSYMSE